MLTYRNHNANQEVAKPKCKFIFGECESKFIHPNVSEYI